VSNVLALSYMDFSSSEALTLALINPWWKVTSGLTFRAARVLGCGEDVCASLRTSRKPIDVRVSQASTGTSRPFKLAKKAVTHFSPTLTSVHLDHQGQSPKWREIVRCYRVCEDNSEQNLHWAS